MKQSGGGWRGCASSRYALFTFFHVQHMQRSKDVSNHLVGLYDARCAAFSSCVIFFLNFRSFIEYPGDLNLSSIFPTLLPLVEVEEVCNLKQKKIDERKTLTLHPIILFGEIKID